MTAGRARVAHPGPRFFCSRWIFSTCAVRQTLNGDLAGFLVGRSGAGPVKDSIRRGPLATSPVILARPGRKKEQPGRTAYSFSMNPV